MAKKWFLMATAVVTLALTATGSAMAETLTIDLALTSYNKTHGVSGNLNSIGSDTLNNLMTFWAEGFRKRHHNVILQIEGKGSSPPPALIEETAQIGPMARKIKKNEEEAFEAKNRPPSVWPSTRWPLMSTKTTPSRRCP